MNILSATKNKIRSLGGAALFVMLLGFSGLFASAYANEQQLFGDATIAGVIGSQLGHAAGRVTSTGTSVLVGGFMGGEIGPSIGQSNSVNYYDSAAAYPLAEKANYAKPYVPNYVAPSAPPPTYVDEASGDYCRDYSELIKVNDHVKESYGTACLQPDGNWRVIQ